MSAAQSRTVELRLAPASVLARRCEDANKALLAVQWAMEDEYQRQDGDQVVIDSGAVSAWKRTLREANAALALAAAALGQIPDA